MPVSGSRAVVALATVAWLLWPASTLASTLATTLATNGVAQGTKADYARAASIESRVGNLVRRDDLDPQWIDAHRCWYAVDTVGGGREFVLVDAAKADRAPLFDHERLAAVLSTKLGKPIDAAQLPIERISLEGSDEQRVMLLLLQGGERTFRYNPRDGSLADATSEDEATFALPLQATELRSRRRAGPSVNLVFVNRSGGEVQLVWIDQGGERRPYARLKDGERHVQQTFAGHAWGVIAADGTPIGWLLARNRGDIVRIGGTEPPPTKPDAAQGTQTTDAPNERPPPESDRGSSRNAYRVDFRDGNAFVVRTSDGTSVVSSTDGTPEHPYVAPPLWSPDGTKVVIVRQSPAQKHTVNLVESSPRDQTQPKLHSFDYLKPGDRIQQTQPYLFDLTTGQAIAIPERDTLFPNPWSIDRLRWTSDSSHFTFLYNQRGHQIMRLVSVDAKTGHATSIVNEECVTFFDYAGKLFLQQLDATNEVLWMSERDGWNHLYLIDSQSGAVKSQITKGDWVVRGVDRVDETQRQIWFRAGGIRPEQDPYYEHFCRVNFDGTGLVVLTAGDGSHEVQYSPDGTYFIDRWSRVDQPPVTELRRTADGSLVCELEHGDWSELLATGWLPPERFVAKGRDGVTDIYGVLWRPSNFDPGTRYPVIEDIYAGPHDSFVPKTFATWHGQREIAELGFIVVRIDGMGTSNRSKAFHDVCWKNLKDGGFPDRVAWLRAAGAAHPEMDLSRVGIYGGSAGGQNALRAMLDHGDMYKACVADCGCHDNRMDKIWWNELWMGWPIDDSYAASSNVTDAHKLTGKLLLVVGELDRNVDPASTMQVVDALVRADKDFELLVIPGSDHGAAESAYGRRRRADFFVRNLLGVEPRAE